MRLTLTIVDPATDQRADVVLEGDGETPIGAVADALAAVLGHDARAAGQVERAAGDAAVLHFPVAAGRSRRMAPSGGTTLYVDGEPLDPDCTLHRAALREGTLVSVDDPSGCLRAEPLGLVEIRVVSGPGAGVVHRLGAGEHDIGSAPDAAVPLDDPQVPGQALTVRVQVDGEVTVAPYDGVAATLDRADLLAPTPWGASTQLAVGESLLELALPSPADAAVEPSSDGTALDYNRPPRLLPPLRQTRFRLPGLPGEQDRRPLPIVMAIVPLVMSVAMAYFMHRWYMLLFGFMSPISLVGSHFYDKKIGRKSHRKKLADYRETKAAIEADATSALLEERTARRAAFPDPASVLLTAVGPRRRLWERRRHDADALTIRVGTGELRDAQQAESTMQSNAGDPLLGVDKPTDAQRSAARTQQDAHADAAGALQAARRRMDDAVHDLDTVAKRAADAIKDASDDDVKDGFWDKVKGFISDHAAFIKAVCDIIGKITLVLSFVVLALALTIGAPFVLLVGLAILTAIALVGHTALASAGEGSWVDVGLDVFALATFGIGGGLARAGEQAGAEAVAQAGRVASTEAAERVLSQNRTMLAVSRWATETRIPLGPLRSLGVWKAARIVAESTRAGDVAEALVTTRPLTAVPFRQALPTLDREIAQRLDLVRAVTREFPSAEGIEAARRFAMYSYTQGGVTAVGLGVDVADKSGAFDGAKGSHAK